MLLGAGCGSVGSSSEDVADGPDESATEGDAPREDDGAPDGDADDDGGADGDDDVAPDADADDDGGAPDGDADSDADADVPADADGDDVPDAEVVTDADGDTYPASIDCDDHDPLVYPGTFRACSSACGTGTERCDAGSWVGCTAPTDCACAPPGTTRTVDCGRCGLASQRCGSGGVWDPPGACMSEGECSIGAVETEMCGLCGTRNRICDGTCRWRPWDACVDPGGECTRGADEIVRTGCPEGQIQRRVCTDACVWTAAVACTTDCILLPRTGGHQEEVCIPGGPFVMGENTEAGIAYDPHRYVHEVILSPYLVDRFGVTNGRYRACVDAGACAGPRDLTATYFNPDRATYDSYPVAFVTWADAVAFCAWDGGRVLLTEAQWEKAARGPAPRTDRYPWGTDTAYCTYVNNEMCGTAPAVSVDLYPLNVSFYGVRGMLANVYDWTRDWYDAAYYPISPTFDPTGPSAGIRRTYRGGSFLPAATIRYYSNSYRGHCLPTDNWASVGFRCAREPWTE